MSKIIIFIGIIFIILGFLYFYMPNVIIKICDFIRMYLLSDKIVILHNKKIGLILFLLGCVILLVKISRYYTHRDKYYLATREFYNKNYIKAEKLCIEILSNQPRNTMALELLGKIYLTTNRVELARKIFTKIKTMDEKKSEKMDQYLKKLSLQKE